MKPYYEHGGITIYHSRCEDVLPTLPPVDLVVTSPPYNKVGHEGFIRKVHQRDAWKRRHIEYGDCDDFLSEQDYQAQQVAILNAIYAVLVDGGSVFYNHKPRVKDFVCTLPYEWLRHTPLKLRQEIIWDRASGPNVDPIKFFATTERVYWLFKGTKPRYFNPEAAAYKEVWRITPDFGNVHPAPFPLELASRCVLACSRPDDLVLDPFGGSGTTARACKDLGRRCILIEQNEAYCEVSARRLSQEVLAL